MEVSTLTDCEDEIGFDPVRQTRCLKPPSLQHAAAEQRKASLYICVPVHDGTRVDSAPVAQDEYHHFHEQKSRLFKQRPRWLVHPGRPGNSQIGSCRHGEPAICISAYGRVLNADDPATSCLVFPGNSHPLPGQGSLTRPRENNKQVPVFDIRRNGLSHKENPVSQLHQSLTETTEDITGSPDGGAKNPLRLVEFLYEALHVFTWNLFQDPAILLQNGLNKGMRIHSMIPWRFSTALSTKRHSVTGKSGESQLQKPHQNCVQSACKKQPLNPSARFAEFAEVEEFVFPNPVTGRLFSGKGSPGCAT
jgi:hypothetical protein